MNLNQWLVLFTRIILCFLNINCDNDCIKIISRAEWNATAPRETKPLAIIPPPFVVVHHSATESCSTEDECKKMVKGIQNYHMDNLGWEDIGYNFLIGGDRNVYEGRGWGIHGAHVIKYNARSIGICLLGNFQEKPPPNIQVKVLEDLISCAKLEKYISEDYHLIGHRQGSPTLCPGDYLFKLLKNWQHFDPNPQ